MDTGATDTKFAGIRDSSVRLKTGKGWDEWFTTLDRVGGTGLGHGALSTYLRDKHNLPDWWSQMVAVGYEQARGLREKAR